jgi:hypothetical protein
MDRRAETSHGYRAVHVIISLEGVSIEVQVRTLLQHCWADLMERLADRFGRQIRYGGSPVPTPGMTQNDADNVVRMMMNLSGSWATAEAANDGLYVASTEFDVGHITNTVWSTLTGALSRSGIDL